MSEEKNTYKSGEDKKYDLDILFCLPFARIYAYTADSRIARWWYRLFLDKIKPESDSFFSPYVYQLWSDIIRIWRYVCTYYSRFIVIISPASMFLRCCHWYTQYLCQNNSCNIIIYIVVCAPCVFSCIIIQDEQRVRQRQTTKKVPGRRQIAAGRNIQR